MLRNRKPRGVDSEVSGCRRRRGAAGCGGARRGAAADLDSFIATPPLPGRARHATITFGSTSHNMSIGFRVPSHSFYFDNIARPKCQAFASALRSMIFFRILSATASIDILSLVKAIGMLRADNTQYNRRRVAIYGTGRSGAGWRPDIDPLQCARPRRTRKGIASLSFVEVIGSRALSL
ncbi:hypothetical protein EVAR_96610_1 [Eumeta japonica]|uniref:Uncharacterized protein n=1 Tax=Eumeta variegata TaxID=151549 RepID=A0A4C1WTL7_EUMVA|nr:hypothetical protein EVAR_96610_1 [Eumeta japonica]